MTVRYEVRTGLAERVALFGAGVLVLAGLFWFFRLHDFLVFFFLWPAAGLALWAMAHAVFGRDETWRFDEGTVVRVRRNCLGRAETAWRYDEVDGVRVRASSVNGRDGYRVEFRVGERWLGLPAQKDQASAERMLAELDVRRKG
ncbi:MAG: hypothetical protein JF615_08080 [Asticcacaulis sp.]|nr:hypothetical protein [Asticcacaulis sp.]